MLRRQHGRKMLPWTRLVKSSEEISSGFMMFVVTSTNHDSIMFGHETMNTTKTIRVNSNLEDPIRESRPDASVV